ncbi:hypothetical protein EIP86_000966 [Pleurotus ostreatoroseus]|nr:hypothetical protein EIP86_000966 [Pleurotus ostreatoroseus]
MSSAACSENLPSTIIRGHKPDWKRADDADPRDADYYESDRALGKLYRNITPSLPADSPPPTSFTARSGSLSDTISEALKPYIVRQLGIQAVHTPNADFRDLEPLFRGYADELSMMRSLHTLKNAPGSVLLEEEVVLGVILVGCSLNKHRSDRAYRMRYDASVLVDNIRGQLYKRGREEHSQGEIRVGLRKAWRCWNFATRQRGVSGSRSFALIALRAVLEALAALGEISVEEEIEFEESAESS